MHANCTCETSKFACSQSTAFHLRCCDMINILSLQTHALFASKAAAAALSRSHSPWPCCFSACHLSQAKHSKDTKSIQAAITLVEAFMIYSSVSMAGRFSSMNLNFCTSDRHPIFPVKDWNETPWPIGTWPLVVSFMLENFRCLQPFNLHHLFVIGKCWTSAVDRKTMAECCLLSFLVEPWSGLPIKTDVWRDYE